MNALPRPPRFEQRRAVSQRVAQHTVEPLALRMIAVPHKVRWDSTTAALLSIERIQALMLQRGLGGLGDRGGTSVGTLRMSLEGRQRHESWRRSGTGYRAIAQVDGLTTSSPIRERRARRGEGSLIAVRVCRLLKHRFRPCDVSLVTFRVD